MDAYLLDERLVRPFGAGRTAIVTRDDGAEPVLVVREAHVPDPGRAAAMDGRALRVHVPSVTGRRKVVLFDWPTAKLPSVLTARWVVTETIDSASAA